VSMAEIATCVRCGQWAHDPENGWVCAECKAADLADEHRDEIESALAYLDAVTAIEIFRGTSHTRLKVRNRKAVGLGGLV
jgi:hypothetical protein